MVHSHLKTQWICKLLLLVALYCCRTVCAVQWSVSGWEYLKNTVVDQFSTHKHSIRSVSWLWRLFPGIMACECSLSSAAKQNQSGHCHVRNKNAPNERSETHPALSENCSMPIEKIWMWSKKKKGEKGTCRCSDRPNVDRHCVVLFCERFLNDGYERIHSNIKLMFHLVLRIRRVLRATQNWTFSPFPWLDTEPECYCMMQIRRQHPVSTLYHTVP